MVFSRFSPMQVKSVAVSKVVNASSSVALHFFSKRVLDKCLTVLRSKGFMYACLVTS